MPEVESGFVLARILFLENRRLCMAQVEVNVQLTDRRFNVGETGHRAQLATWLNGKAKQADRGPSE